MATAPWLEVWSRPGADNYQKKIADLPFTDASVTVPYSGVGKGNMSVPSDFSRLDEILLIDTDTPEDSVWSTVKVFDDTGWLYEWLPIPRTPVDGSKQGTDVQFAGDGLEMMWGFASVEPFDWDGSVNWVSTFPDWIWGGKNLLSNPDMEDPDVRAEVNEITSNASQGTFTLSDGPHTTPPIPFDTGAVGVEGLIELHLTNIDDVLVTLDETEWTHVPDTGPDVIITTRLWHIEFVAPAIFSGGLIFNPGTLANPNLPIAIPNDETAPGLEEGEDVVFIADLKRETFGALQPGAWTRSQVVSRGVPKEFGIYQSFRVTTERAHSPIYSLRIDPAAPINQYTRYAGAQQVVRVQPNGIYQASIWVYTTSATDTYRFIIRGIDEDFIDSSTHDLGSVTLTPNTWNQLVINDVNVGDNDSIIFRIANTNPPGTGNPVPFWVDDGEFNEGRMPTTIGCMLEELYADATADHAPGRIVWQNETTGPSIDPVYLTLDFDCDVDSNGIAWDRDDVKHTFTPRMSYLQVIDQIVEEGGYNWRVVPNDVEAGTYFLQVYNPGDLGGVQEAGIIAGSSDTSRRANFFAPEATFMIAEGDESRSSRVSNAGLVSAFGRIESSLLDHNWTTNASLNKAGTEALNAFLYGAQDVVYTLASPEQRPLVAYRPGDRIRVHDPGVVEDYRRVAQIQLSMSKTQPDEFVVHISDAIPFRFLGGAGVKLARGLVGQAATDNAVAALLKAYKRREPSGGGALGVGVGGGMATVLVCNESSSEMVRNKADYIVPDFDDASGQLRQIIAQHPDLSTIWVHGYLNIHNQVTLPSGVQLVGLSIRGSWIDIRNQGKLIVGTEGLLKGFTVVTDCTEDAVVLGTSARAEQLLCLGAESSGGSIFRLTVGASITDVMSHGAEASGGFIYLDGESWQQVNRVVINGEGLAIRAVGTTHFTISDVIVNGCDRGLILDGCNQGSVSNWQSMGGGDGVEDFSTIVDCFGVTFTGCHFNGATPGSTTKAAVTIENSEYIDIDGSNQFSDFAPFGDDRAVIIFEGSRRCTLSAMFMGLSSGPTGTSLDFVRVLNSDDNFITYGHYQPHGLYALGSMPRHAVLIGAGSLRNVVAGNRFGDDARYHGVTLSDLGTDTIIYFPADAVIGDNFEDSTMGGGGPGVVLADLAYTHVQGVASTLWTINHPLGFQPNVAVVDSAGDQVEGDVTYVDADTITLEFSAAFSGTAYLS